MPRRSKCPDGTAEIDREAQHEDQRKRSDAEFVLEGRIFDQSIRVRELAAEAVLRGLPGMERIAKGEPTTVEIVSDNGVTELKTSVQYQRDQIAAFNPLVATAREGLINVAHRLQNGPDTVSESVESLSSFFRTSPNFRTISALIPDVRIIIASVDDPDRVTSIRTSNPRAAHGPTRPENATPRETLREAD